MQVVAFVISAHWTVIDWNPNGITSNHVITMPPLKIVSKWSLAGNLN